eukprot:CAMPEP_0179142486 /NCGR_PEP_ID=MMETSP0796-20121207/68434_1 /TAXON_ID=73915 /ORGANISM="Pyrodinium bahamense, Strain pbaha01" /LENGTH=35 /DNA_ID= /DNA_START= /DNA_END= /DNA_ORIENTATION=
MATPFIADPSLQQRLRFFCSPSCMDIVRMKDSALN